MEFFKDEEEMCSSQSEHIMSSETSDDSSMDSNSALDDLEDRVSRHMVSPMLKACLQSVVAIFRSNANSLTWFARSFEALNFDEARFTKYYDRLNPELPLDFGLYLIEVFEEIDYLESKGELEIARAVESVCREAMKEADRLIAMECSAKYDVESFLHEFDALRNRIETEIAAVKMKAVPTDHHAIQPAHRKSLASKPTSSFSDNDLERIRQHLYSTISSWHPDAVDAGGGKYHILSPFRSDMRKGSFVIFPNGKARDFATGERYDVIDIWAKLNGLSLGDALRTLAERLGIARLSNRVSTPATKTTPNIPPDNFPEPDESFFVHPKHGKPSQIYCYRDLQGQIIGYIGRYDTPDQGRTKHFCPFSFTRDAQGRPIWTKSAKGWNGVAPIFGLEKLKIHPERRLVIVEGEKTALAAEKLFPDHLIISWQGGASNAGKADWSQLSGHTVDFIWPDADQKRDPKTGQPLGAHDQPGMKATLKIASALSRIGLKPKIVMPPEGVEDGWDLADALDEGWTPEKALAHAMANLRSHDEIQPGQEGSEQDGPARISRTDVKWRATDIAADIRRAFDQAVEEGSIDRMFPFTKNFRNYVPSAGGSSRACTPILVSVSEMGQVVIIPPDAFIDEFVRWYDTTGRLNYGEVNLSEDQMKALALRIAHRLPRIGSEPLIFKRPSEPGYAWQVLNIESNPNCLDLAAVPDSHPEADQFSMDLLAESCPTWHEQLSRMRNRLGFLCYLGCILDLDAKPQQYLWLYGEGQDGKSSILKVLKRVLGAAAIATDWPANPNNFFTVRFEGRRVALVDEEPGGSCVRTDLWKRVTGSDTITIEPKGKQAYEIRNNLLIIVASNNRPATKAQKADRRRLVVCELETYNGPLNSTFEDRLLDEFPDFISLCQLLWKKFKEPSGLVPVDDDETLKNLEEINAEVSETINEHFEVFDADKIKSLLKDPNCVNKRIPHTLLAEINRVCATEKITRSAARDYLVGVLGLPAQVVSYSKANKPRAVFGIVPRPNTRRKYCIPERSFDLLPACRPVTLVHSAE
jgi:hypothetical protein